MMKPPLVTRKRLGDLLCHVGLITEADLEKALEEQKRTGKHLGETLILLNLATEFDITKTLADQLGIPQISLEATPIEPEAISLLPETLARKYDCIPINLDKRYLTVAMVDPLDYEAIKDMGFHSTKEIKPFIATRKEIQEAIDQHYHLDDSVEHIVNETIGIFQGAGLEISPVKTSSELIAADYLEKKSQMAPIVRMVNYMILKAIHSRADPESIRRRDRPGGPGSGGGQTPATRRPVAKAKGDPSGDGTDRVRKNHHPLCPHQPDPVSEDQYHDRGRPSCHRPLQAEWVVCPYCKKDLF